MYNDHLTTDNEIGLIRVLVL